MCSTRQSNVRSSTTATMERTDGFQFRLGNGKAASLFRQFTDTWWQELGEITEYVGLFRVEIKTVSCPTKDHYPSGHWMWRTVCCANINEHGNGTGSRQGPLWSLALGMSATSTAVIQKYDDDFFLSFRQKSRQGWFAKCWLGSIVFLLGEVVSRLGYGPTFPLAFGRSQGISSGERSSHGERCLPRCTGETVLLRHVGRYSRTHHGHATRLHLLRKFTPIAKEMLAINRWMSLRRRKYDVLCGIVARTRIGSRGSSFLFDLSQMRVANSNLTDNPAVWKVRPRARVPVFHKR